METISLSRKRRDKNNLAIAVWSPVSAGKTTIAVNLAVMLAKSRPTALVDLCPDYAVHTYLNCTETRGIFMLAGGDKEGYITPVYGPDLMVFTAVPGSKPAFNGEAWVLSNISKALQGYTIVFDVPRDPLKAANVLTLADQIIMVADYNIHGTMLLQKYTADYTLVVNRYRKEIPRETDPVMILNKEPVARLPDEPGKAAASILTGIPLAGIKEFKYELFKLVEVTGGEHIA